MFVFLLITSLF